MTAEQFAMSLAHIPGYLQSILLAHVAIPSCMYVHIYIYMYIDIRIYLLNIHAYSPYPVHIAHVCILHLKNRSASKFVENIRYVD